MPGNAAAYKGLLELEYLKQVFENSGANTGSSTGNKLYAPAWTETKNDISALEIVVEKTGSTCVGPNRKLAQQPATKNVDLLQEFAEAKPLLKGPYPDCSAWLNQDVMISASEPGNRSSIAPVGGKAPSSRASFSAANLEHLYGLPADVCEASAIVPQKMVHHSALHAEEVDCVVSADVCLGLLQQERLWRLAGQPQPGQAWQQAQKAAWQRQEAAWQVQPARSATFNAYDHGLPWQFGMEIPSRGCQVPVESIAKPDGLLENPREVDKKIDQSFQGGDTKDNTLSSHLRELEKVDAARVIIVRKINRLGLRSAEILKRHYSRYGAVDRVLVAHSRVPHEQRSYGARVRPSSLGFVVMSKKEEAEAILDDGPEHTIWSTHVKGPTRMWTIHVKPFQDHTHLKNENDE